MNMFAKKCKFAWTKFWIRFLRQVPILIIWSIIDKLVHRPGIQLLFDKSNLLSVTTRVACIFTSAPVKIQASVSNNKELVTKYDAQDEPKLRTLKLRCYLNFIIGCVQVLQCVLISKHGLFKASNNTIFEYILGWFNCILIFGCTSCIYTFRNNGKISAMYINNLFKFKKNIEVNKVIKTFASLSLIEELNLLSVPMLLASCTLFGTIYVLAFHLINPCKLSLIGYFLLDECNNTTGPSSVKKYIFAIRIFIKIVLFLGNIWVYSFGLIGILFIFISNLVIGSSMTLENIKMFWKRLQNSTDIYRDSLVYRQFQIFNSLSNYLQTTCLGVVVYTTIFALSINLSLVIGFNNFPRENISSIMIGLFLIVAIENGVVILVIQGGLVSVYIASKRTILGAKHLELSIASNKNRKWARKFWRSCEILKAKFGNGNFLEELTPLRCLDFAFGLTVQFLLLSRGKQF